MRQATLLALLLALFHRAALAFNVPAAARGREHSARAVPRGKGVEAGEQELDPYLGLLDLDRPMEADARDSVLPHVSISALESAGGRGSQNLPSARSRRPQALIKPKKRWEHWDDWMQQEMGDLDAELQEKDKWVLELRDIVEQKRGAFD